jgi:hypothetical protein
MHRRPLPYTAPVPPHLLILQAPVNLLLLHTAVQGATHNPAKPFEDNSQLAVCDRHLQILRDSGAC